MKKGRWLLAGLGLVAALIAAVLLLSPAASDNTATVIELVNRVEAHPRPKQDWQPAQVNLSIYGGGQVRTGADSSVRLELLEGTVRLSADSLFTVTHSVTRKGMLLTQLFLQAGRLWVHLTTDQPHDFVVETGNAVAAVRDTRFSVQVADGQTLVSVAEGRVELTAQKQSVTVVAGEQASVEQGQPPSPPQPMDAEERVLWATEGEMPGWLPATPASKIVASSTPTPTSVPTFTPKPSPTPKLIPTPVPIQTKTPSPAFSPAPTATPPPTPTAAPSPTSTPSPTLQPAATSTPTPTITPLPAPSPTEGEPVGQKINLFSPPEPRIQFPAGEPFHIQHGWKENQDPLQIGLDFELEVDGILRNEDYLLMTIDPSGDEQMISRLWLHNFAEGMTGTHLFTAHWFAPCQWAIDHLDFAGPCSTPNERVEPQPSSLTVDFVPQE
ncbi:MAG: FecR domain-containing protein [Chloroflexota bacterium]